MTRIFEQNKSTIKEWARRVDAGEGVEDLETVMGGKYLASGHPKEPSWNKLLYRFPPKTINVNGVDIEAPFAPKVGEGYHFLDTNGIDAYDFKGDRIDLGILSLQPVFRTQEAAETYHNLIHKPYMPVVEDE